MKKIKDGRNKVIEVQLDKGEQLMLMKENNKRLREQKQSGLDDKVSK